MSSDESRAFEPRVLDVHGRTMDHELEAEIAFGKYTAHGVHDVAEAAGRR
jgi:hypothetical protein